MLSKKTTPGGLPRYKEWLAALRAYYKAEGDKVHEANWFVDAGYIGRTIQLFKDRLSGHKNKPQLTYTILDHCQKIRKKSGGRIVIVGLVKAGTMIELPALDITRKEITVVGSRASTQCFPTALALLASGKIRYPQVATEFSMWDAPRVFAEINATPTKYHKGVLKIL